MIKKKVWVKNYKIILRNVTFKLEYNANHIIYWPIIKFPFSLLISKLLNNMKATYSMWAWMSEILIAYFWLNNIGNYLAIKKIIWKSPF